MKAWQTLVVTRVVEDGEQPPRPRWGSGGVPFCSEGDCPFFDGKRCMALGHRPDSICEPVVAAMAARLAEEPTP